MIRMIKKIMIMPWIRMIMMIMTVKEMNLDVVIEGAVLVAVVLEQSERVLVAKVLKLDQRLLPEPPHDRLHELLDEVVVLLASDPLLTKTNVVRVVKVFLSVAANVKGDREGLVRRNRSQS